MVKLDERAVQDQLGSLIKAVEATPATNDLRNQLEQGVAGTGKIAGKHGAAAVRYSEVVVAIPDEPGALARLFGDVSAAGVNVEDISIEHDPDREVGYLSLSVAPEQAGALVEVVREVTERFRDVKVALAEGYLPIPSVTWRKDGLRLTVTAFAQAGPGDASTLYARYALSNDRTGPARPKLFLALRPFQVNPPSQFLNVPGGVAKIASLVWDGRQVTIDGRHTVAPLDGTPVFGAAAFDEGELVEGLRRGKAPLRAEVRDPAGFASGVLAYDLELAAGETKTVSLRIPFRPAALFPASPEQRLAATRKDWSDKLGHVRFRVPADAETLVATLRSNLAYILINRDGPAIQPGSRAYDRSWIRDGALTSSALLKLGHERPVREFIAWFAPKQFENGKVPCCVDTRGADPVPDRKSVLDRAHGEDPGQVPAGKRQHGPAAGGQQQLVEGLGAVAARSQVPHLHPPGGHLHRLHLVVQVHLDALPGQVLRGPRDQGGMARDHPTDQVREAAGRVGAEAGALEDADLEGRVQPPGPGGGAEPGRHPTHHDKTPGATHASIKPHAAGRGFGGVGESRGDSYAAGEHVRAWSDA